jgi:cytochrome bd ubiquinol oxidase subunit I
MTAELGRQPWLVYGLFETNRGVSAVVNGGNVLFTLIGLCGLYFVLGLLFLFLVWCEIAHGPNDSSSNGPKETPNGHDLVRDSVVPADGVHSA